MLKSLYSSSVSSVGISVLSLPSPSARLYCKLRVVSSAQTIQRKQSIRSPELVALEYSDLHFSNNSNQDVGQIKIRQHVNPLSLNFATPVPVPDWHQVFTDPTLPLMVDIGCGSGRFLIWHAKRNPEAYNYLGLELRKKLVQRANFWAKEICLRNIHFLFANATNSFKQLVDSYPGSLMLVTILCPDPHFKRRHHKRRVVQKALVNSIANALIPGGQVLIQSDVLEVALDMRNQFDELEMLDHVDSCDNVLCDNEGWLLKNPMGLRTEREIHAEFQGSTIYRRMYQKRK